MRASLSFLRVSDGLRRLILAEILNHARLTPGAGIHIEDVRLILADAIPALDTGDDWSLSWQRVTSV